MESNVTMQGLGVQKYMQWLVKLPAILVKGRFFVPRSTLVLDHTLWLRQNIYKESVCFPSRQGFSTSELLTLDWNILAAGAVLGIAGCLATCLTLTHQMLWLPKMTPDVAHYALGGRESMQSKTELTSCLQIVGCPGACSAFSIIKATSSCWGKNGAKAQGLLRNSCARPL